MKNRYPELKVIYDAAYKSLEEVHDVIKIFDDVLSREGWPLVDNAKPARVEDEASKSKQPTDKEEEEEEEEQPATSEIIQAGKKRSSPELDDNQAATASGSQGTEGSKRAKKPKVKGETEPVPLAEKRVTRLQARAASEANVRQTRSRTRAAREKR